MKFSKKIILFTLSLKTEIFLDKSRLNYVSYDFLYKRLFLPKSTIRAGILELCSDDLVDKIVRNKKPFFRLTSLGKAGLLSFLPLFLKEFSWDKKWRLLIFLANDKNNIKIKHFLEEKGFVSLQKKAYVGLMDINKELVSKGWGRLVFVFAFLRPELWTSKELAVKLWGLERINSNCVELIDQWQALLKKLKQGKRMVRESKFAFFVLLKSSLSLMQRAPNLPEQLLPNDWQLGRLRKVICKASNKLNDVNDGDEI